VPDRLTDAQLRNARAQALRSIRRAQRSMDTRIEVMERRLDRSIENKERITVEVMMSIIDDYRKLTKHIRVLEDRITDAMQIFNMVVAR